MTTRSFDEQFAAPPRLPKLRRHTTAGDVDLDDGRAFLKDSLVDDGPGVFAGAVELDIETCTIVGTSLGELPTFEVTRRLVVDAYRCEFETCDLGGDRFRSLRQCRFVGCGFTGGDFADGEVTDVVFERCVFRLSSFRMARFERVRFVDCHLSGVDAFELAATDVDVEGSRIEAMNLDRLDATRVDLRGATELSFEVVGRLDGCLVTGSQLQSITYELAAAVGLQVDPDS